MKRFAQRLLSPVPGHLSKNHIKIDRRAQEALVASLEANFYKGWRAEGNYSQRGFEADLAAHLCEALQGNRAEVIPWLDSARRLRGLRVLEIGCGTGSSTVALAEQGARVTGIDLDEGSLRVARERCRIYGVEAELIKQSAESIASFGADTFDLVIFSASLEHMTSAERLAALKGAWHILPAGGLLAVVHTPNRLWYFDTHTSWLPFYHWLPNDLAFQYAKFSSRENFRELYSDYNSASKQHFLRRGRGVSFHEFELAIKPATTLKVVSSLASHRGLVRRLLGGSARRRHKALLMSLCPGVHEGFFDPYLELVIARD